MLPTFFKSKGFIDRLLTIPCSPGNPQYDITEVVNDAGDPKYKKLYNELVDLRKLLLVFRILNYDSPIPDIETSLKNRDKQLCKPLMRLFQNHNCLDDIRESLSYFISEKRDRKRDSLDSYLYSVIADIIKSGNFTIPNDLLWEMIIQLPGDSVPNNPHSYQTEDFGKVSKTQITKIYTSNFEAKKSHDGRKRSLIFNPNTIAKLESNYSPSKKIEIYTKIQTNTFNTFNTFWKRIEGNDPFSIKNNRRNLKKPIQNIANNVKDSVKVSENEDQDPFQIDYPHDKKPTKVLDVLKVLEYNKKVEGQVNDRGLYRKWPRADTWACPYCKDNGDKWYMVEHICKMNKKNARSY